MQSVFISDADNSLTIKLFVYEFHVLFSKRAILWVYKKRNHIVEACLTKITNNLFSCLRLTCISLTEELFAFFICSFRKKVLL